MDSQTIPTTGHPIVDSIIVGTIGIGLGTSSLVFVLWAIWVKVGPLLKRIEGFSKTSAEQTANSHANSEFPNLRDNLDAIFAEVRAQGEAQREIQRDIGGLRAEIRDDRKATREIGEKLDQHIHDKRDFEPRLIALESSYLKITDYQ